MTKDHTIKDAYKEAIKHPNYIKYNFNIEDFTKQ